MLPYGTDPLLGVEIKSMYAVLKNEYFILMTLETQGGRDLKWSRINPGLGGRDFLYLQYSCSKVLQTTNVSRAEYLNEQF